MRILAGLTRQDLEDIYELTYKYQMLKQEAALGDYGVPQQLPDNAYIALERIKQELSDKLSNALPIMEEVFSGWLEHHMEQEDQQLYDDTLNDLESSIYHAVGYEDLQELFGDGDELREAFVHAKPEWEEMGTEQEMIDATEALGPVEEADIFKSVKTFLAEHPNLPEIAEDISREQQNENYNKSAITGVQDAHDDIEYALDADLDFQIEVFQKALTTAHNTGSMAEHVLEDPSATEFLSELSAGPHVEQWNKDLSQLLGYPLGSRTVPKSDWFVSSHLKIAIQMLAKLARGFQMQRRYP